MAIKFIDKVPSVAPGRPGDAPDAVGIVYDKSNGHLAYARAGIPVHIRNVGEEATPPVVDDATIVDTAGTIAVDTIDSSHTVGVSGAFSFGEGTLLLTWENGLLVNVEEVEP